MTKAAVYRHIGEGEEVLYIGASWNPGQRLMGHISRSSWIYNVKRIDVEWFPDRPSALRAERAAIMRERPPHNEEWKVPKNKGRKWRANEAHCHLSAWMRSTGTSIEEFARRAGVSLRYARRMVSEPTHPQGRTVSRVILATDGYVPDFAWAQYNRGAPIIRSLTAKEAGQAKAKEVERLTFAAKSGQGWAMQALKDAYA